MTERIPVSPKLRFEVFKRDKFTCQYCGAKAPDVVLEADHIEPVAVGGKRPHLRKLLYIQGILRCRSGELGLNCIDFLQTLVDAGFNINEMERRAKRIDDLADFDMPYLTALSKQRKS